MIVQASALKHLAVETQTLAQTQAMPRFAFGNGVDAEAAIPAADAKEYAERAAQLVQCHCGCGIVIIAAVAGHPAVPARANPLFGFRQKSQLLPPLSRRRMWH